jgi:hypothetical protein
VRRSAAAAALALALLAGCGGGGGSQVVAHVGGQPIGQKQLDALVAHFRTEAQREGKPFPKEGTKAFERLRNQLLSLLVYRTELRQAAKRLGVEIDQSEVTKRLAPTGGGEQEGDPGGDTFARESVEAQLLTEGIFAKVTSGVGGKDKAERSARRNRKMAGFLARLQRETQVRYEPGFAPGS